MVMAGEEDFDTYIESADETEFNIAAESAEEIEDTDNIIDEIFLDTNVNFKYKVNSKKQVKTVAAEKNDDSNASGINIKKGDFSVSSTSKKSKNDYMNETLKQRTEAKYEKKYFEISTGMETKYENTDASKNSQNVFLSPKLKVGDQFSVLFNNKVSPTGSTVEQEVGINYKPKLLENSTFGVSGSTVFKNGVESSQKMRFNSDFYLW